MEDRADCADSVRASVCELRRARAPPGGQQGHRGSHDESEETHHWRRGRRQPIIVWWSPVEAEQAVDGREVRGVRHGRLRGWPAVPAHTQPHRKEDRERVSTELHRKQGQRIGRQGTHGIAFCTCRLSYYHGG